MSSNSKRRSFLGINVRERELVTNQQSSWYYRFCSSYVEVNLNRSQRFELLRRAKFFLASRAIDDPNLVTALDWRRIWNKNNHMPNSLLDLFPSLKFSHDTLLPFRVRQLRRTASNAASTTRLFDAVNILSSTRDGKSRVRLDDLCRSHSIWLDPVEAPKELYRWRLRIQRAIAWAYDNNCVPVMLTLTIPHRWHRLKDLLKILQGAFEKFLSAGRPACRRKEAIGLRGYVRRLEVTINDGFFIGENDEGNGNTLNCHKIHTIISPRRAAKKTFSREDTYTSTTTNTGWHPHYHVILFVSLEGFAALADIENQLKAEWSDIVIEQFKKVLGEDLDTSLKPALMMHGLHLSRYTKGKRKGQLRPVKDSIYLDKIEGYDCSHLYGVDNEIASTSIKNSKIPFDLLREVTASNIDLWCEYAIAMKGIPALHFSRPLIKQIDAYFEAHPNRNPVPGDLPPSVVVARLAMPIYLSLYDRSLVPELLARAKEGYESLALWVTEQMEDTVLPGGVPIPIVRGSS